jgi:hypothetical protein
MNGSFEPGYFWQSLRMDELIAEAFAKLLACNLRPIDG